MAKLTVTKGGAPVVDIRTNEAVALDLEQARRLAAGGTVTSALTRLSEEVRDPELREMLKEADRTAIEVFASEAASGAEQERVVAPDDEWASILRDLEEGRDAEVAMSRIHRGGMAAPSAGRMTLVHGIRFTANPVRRVPATYVLKPAEAEAQAAGRLAVFAAKALAEALCVAKAAPGEVLLYWLGRAANGYAVETVLVPEQAAGPAYCEAPGRSVTAAARAARRRGLEIVGSAHSHSSMAVFTSNTDDGNETELAREGHGIRSFRAVRLPAAAQAGENGAARYSFEGELGCLSLVATGGTAGQATLAGELRMPRLTTSFGTINRHGDLLIPSIRRDLCPVCGGAASEEKIDPAGVTVYVKGEPVTLSDAEQEHWRNEVRTKVKSWVYVAPCGPAAYGVGAHMYATPCTAAAPADAEDWGASGPAHPERPDTIHIYAGTRFLGSIPREEFARLIAAAPGLTEWLYSEGTESC